MSDLRELTKTLNQVGDAFEVFKSNTSGRLDEFEKGIMDRVEALEARGTGIVGGKAVSAEAKAFDRFMRTGEIELKEMSISGGSSAGGAMVPEQIAREIIARAINRSPLASMVRSTTASTSDYVRLMNLRGATASWAAETDSRNPTGTPSLREVKPTHGELYAYPAITNWLLQDSMFDVAAFLTQNVGDQFGLSLGAAIHGGDGSSKPTGIFNTAPVTTADQASPERSADTIQYVAGTGKLAEDLIDLFFTLKTEYRARAQWAMSSSTLASVRKLKDTNGQFLWQANLGGGVDAGDGSLLGKPVRIVEDMDVIGASPAGYPIAVGDWDAAYELVRIGGLMITRDEVTTPGKVKFYIRARFGGRLTDNDAIKCLKA